MTDATITVYQDEAGEWRWRMTLGNHVKFAASGESFDSKHNAERAAQRLARLITTDEVALDLEVR